MKILFPATNRVHLARQSTLLDMLSEHFDVVIVEPEKKEGNMEYQASRHGRWFSKMIHDHRPDLVLIRGDRFEMLPMAMVAVYAGVKVAHIEGGDQSGVVDNKVRHAITQLSDYHFATNNEAYSRLIRMGTDPDHTFNFGSLDVEFAHTANESGLKRIVDEPYVMIAFHPFPEEDGSILRGVIEHLDGLYKIVNITSNSDYGMEYKGESYEPLEYLSLLKHANCLIGNSSSFLKEASIFGTPVVDIGTRQNNRLKPKNVVSVPYDSNMIIHTTDLLLNMGSFPQSDVYFKPDTSLHITNKLIELCQKKI